MDERALSASHFAFTSSHDQAEWVCAIPSAVRWTFIIQRARISLALLTLLYILTILLFQPLPGFIPFLLFHLANFSFVYYVLYYLGKNQQKENYFNALFSYVDRHGGRLGTLARIYPPVSFRWEALIFLLLAGSQLYALLQQSSDNLAITLLVFSTLFSIFAARFLFELQGLLRWTNKGEISAEDHLLHLFGSNYFPFDEVIPFHDIQELSVYKQTINGYENLILYVVASGIKFLAINAFYQPQDDLAGKVLHAIEDLHKVIQHENHETELQVYHNLDEMEYQSGRVVR